MTIDAHPAAPGGAPAHPATGGAPAHSAGPERLLLPVRPADSVRPVDSLRPVRPATIVDIQRFSVHDGPGIRTTVFFKGCPLACRWCHNPDSQRRTPQLLYDPQTCATCLTCVQTCPHDAVSFDGERIVTDSDRCTQCGDCVTTCVHLARAVVGQSMTVDEVFAEVLKDQVFYRHSGGGVTLSGGEPLVHADFAEELLRRLHAEGVHTAVDTSGAVPFSALARVAAYTDVFLYDLKLADSARHREWVGAGNEQIVDNLRRLTAIHDGVVLRMPLVGGVNATTADIEAAAVLIEGLPIRTIHLLPYHDIARHKYRRLGRDYDGDLMAVPDPAAVQLHCAFLRARGYDVHIGG